MNKYDKYKKKIDDLTEDLDYLLEFIDERYKNKMLCINPDWPKDLKYIYLNNFTYLLIEYLYKFLDIENRIKILRDKYSNKKEDVDKIDTIENEFNKVKKESLEIKEYSKGILNSLKKIMKKIKI